MSIGPNSQAQWARSRICCDRGPAVQRIFRPRSARQKHTPRLDEFERYIPAVARTTVRIPFGIDRIYGCKLLTGLGGLMVDHSCASSNRLVRWLQPPYDPAKLEQALMTDGTRQALDKEGRAAVLFASDWHLNYFSRNHPDLQLLNLPPAKSREARVP